MLDIFFIYLFSHWPGSPLSSAPSLRLAYKDLEQQRKIDEQKLKGLDGKKKEQAERLGMGLGARRCEDIVARREAARLSNFLSHTLSLSLFLFLQWSVSLCDIGHANYPTGEAKGSQDLQVKRILWGWRWRWWWKPLLCKVRATSVFLLTCLVRFQIYPLL